MTIIQRYLTDSFDWSMPYKIAHVTGALSMIGSGWIIMEVLLDPKKRNMTYHRIMFGLSFFDLVSSFGFFLGNWAQYGSFWLGEDYAKGTIESCNASGFIIYLGSLTIPLYSASLSMYYYLTICHRWREEQFKKKFEFYVHALIPSMGIIIAVLPLIMKLYNPWYFYCFPVSNTIRGNQKAGNIFRLLSLLTVIFSASIISYTMIAINREVKKAYRRSILNQEKIIPRRKIIKCCSCLVTSRTSDNPLQDDNRSHRSARENRLEIRSKRVRTMTLLYMFPFLFTWVVPTIMFFATYLSIFVSVKFWPRTFAFNYAVKIYIAIFLPLQGFLNWFVYIYRRHQAAQKSWLSSNRDGFSSIVKKYLYATWDTFLRILNLGGAESDDDDCLLGSGMEVIDFFEDMKERFIEGDIELPSSHMSYIKNNHEKEKGSILSMADETNIEEIA